MVRRARRSGTVRRAAGGFLFRPRPQHHSRPTRVLLQHRTRRLRRHSRRRLEVPRRSHRRRRSRRRHPLAPGGVGPPPAFDPYAAGTPLGAPPPAVPYSYTPPPVAPPVRTATSPLYPNGLPYQFQPTAPNTEGYYATAQRLLQELSAEFTWLYGKQTDPNDLGITRLELTSTFAVPMFYNVETPLLITPGFAFNWLQGPLSDPAADPRGPDLPPQLYDAYLDFAWYPRVNQWLGAELGIRTGVWSDFDHVDMRLDPASSAADWRRCRSRRSSTFCSASSTSIG